MGVSRGTVWRFLQSVRKKVTQALTEGKPLTVTNEAIYPIESFMSLRSSLYPAYG